MALGDYTPTAWVDGTTPAITATTLGHLETKVNELDDNAVAAQALVNIKTVDGTGSGLDADLLDGKHSTSFQPIAISAAGLGQFVYSLRYAGGISETGTWACISFSAAGTFGGTCGVFAGGADFGAGTLNVCWKIT